jgi:hypothetical protein
MITYYRDAQVHITSAGIRVDERRYPLPALRAVWQVRSRRPLRYGSMLLASVALFGAAVVPLLICAGWGFTSTFGRSGPGRVAAALFAVVALATLAALLGRASIELPLNLLDRLHLHGTAHHEIRAIVRGEEIVVFESDDAHRFGKVYRSLRRAIEQQD